MTKTKSTKHALLMSGIALLLCISMLIGSTYAWFTDSVTSGGNIIQSGTLDVTMEWADGTKAVPADDSSDWTDASIGAIFNYDRWEPGYTEVRHIKIANEGTLALKYQLNIVANGEVSELANVIDVYYLDPADQVADRTALKDDNKLGTLAEVLANVSTTASGNLPAGEDHTITLALKMRESAGNQYQGLAIGSDFSVQVLATQLTYENDSFDNQYDVEATYLNKDADGAWLINNIDELYFFASQVNSGNSYLGETVKLTADINLAGYNWIPIGIGDVNGTWIGFNGIFDGQNHTISNVKITRGGGWNGIFGLVGRGTSKVEESISNLTVKNIVIEETNRMTGGIVGQLYGNIENCHVENVTINAIPNMTDKGVYDNGDKIGGVVGWFGDNGNNHYIKGCTAKNVTLKAYRDVAGIVGYIGTTSTVEDCSVDTVSITVDQITNHYGVKDTNAGGVVGRINDPVTVQNNTETNVNVLEVVSDGLYTDGNGKYSVYNAAGMKALHDIISNNVKIVELLANIDMSGTPWTMVDMHADSKGMLSSFNGNGKTISNLVIDGEAMFSRIASSADTVTFSDIVFENVTIDSADSNTAIITKQTYKNLVLDNVDINGASISGETKVATLVGTVYNEKASAITLTVKNCDISDVEITGTPKEPAEERLAGLVAWVADKYSNEVIVLENNTMTNVAINSNSTASEHHALIYISDKNTGASNRYGVYHNEDDGVTLTDCTYIRKVADGLYTDLAGDFYVYNAAGLQALKTWMDDNSNKAFWGKTYNIMADIDATNVTWTTKFMVPDSTTFNGITFNGNGNTISNLIIGGNGLFTGTTKGGDSNAPATFTNITFDNVTVTGDTHHNGVVWGEAYGDITLDKVTVVNSKISGGCNVGALVGRNGENASTIKFVNCTVKNTKVEATQVADYAGASAFLGMALEINGARSVELIFEGTNVSEGNTLTTAEGMQGGGIYTSVIYENNWNNPTVVKDFTNFSGSN